MASAKGAEVTDGSVPADVTKYFRVTRLKSEREPSGLLLLRCRKCRAEWSFPAGRPFSVGTRLALLNHARGHEVR